MTPEYEQVSRLISQVRNARFGQMVSYLEELISTGIWQDFITPEGMHFEFRDGEFDYFLAAMEIDPDVVKRAYIDARDVDGLADKRLRLADITGRGAPRERRERKAVAEIYGERILRYEPVVTDRLALVAADPERRRAYEATGKGLARRGEKVWRARWSDQRSEAEAIAEKLLDNPELAHEVYKILHSRVVNEYQKKRRSEAKSNGSGGSENISANQGDGTT